MRYLLITCLLVLVASCKQSQTNAKKNPPENNKPITEKFKHIVGKHIKSNEVKSLLKDLGSDYEYNDYETVKFYNYNNSGIQLNVTENDTLHLIFLKLDKIDSQIILPHGITALSTRGAIENILGKPDEYSVTTVLSATYLNERLVIKYKSPDSLNLNNKITYLGVIE